MKTGRSSSQKQHGPQLQRRLHFLARDQPVASSRATGSRTDPFIKLHGDDHVVRNNRSTGKICEVQSGDADMDAPIPVAMHRLRQGGPDAGRPHGQGCKTPTLRPQHAAGAQHRVDHRRHRSEPFKAQNTTLRNNDRVATRATNGWTGITETGVGGHANTAVKLTPADVGPDAVYAEIAGCRRAARPPHSPGTGAVRPRGASRPKGRADGAARPATPAGSRASRLSSSPS